MVNTDVTSSESAQARAYLFKMGIPTADIKPQDFAKAAKRMNKTFDELLRYIAFVKTGGQGAGPAPLTRRRLKYDRGQ